jgi:arylformamidase
MFNIKNVAIATTLGIVSLLGIYIANKITKKAQVTEEDVDKLRQLPDGCNLRGCKFTDLTQEITSKTVLFPGDPIFDCKVLKTLFKNDQFELKQMSLGNHTGTHIDFPSHVIKGGKTSSDIDINNLIGDGIIIEIPKNVSSITRGSLLNSPIHKGDFVFFKTANSELLKNGILSKDFVYITPDAATALLEKEVRVVGIDYLSPDQYEAEDLPVHKILLSHDILIVEGLNLYGINPCRCKLFILPLNIPEMDGLPARVLMQPR